MNNANPRLAAPARRPLLALVAVLGLLAGASAPLAAQGFGDALKNTVKHAVRGEVERKTDEQARKATRCAMGEAGCQSEQENKRASNSAGPRGAAAANTDPALIPRYQGSEIINRKFDEFTDYGLRTGKLRNTGTRTVEGRLTRITYRAPANRSVLEVFRNYETTLREAGFQTLFTCVREACGDIPEDIQSEERFNLLWGSGDHRYLAAKLARNGGEIHVAVFATRNESGGESGGRAMAQVDVVESGEMEDRMETIDASALRADLVRDGRVALYGIRFDTDKDTLRPDSDAQIAQIAQLLAQDAKLSIRVVGHTDATGSASHNRQLSQRRAARVVDTLVTRHGIARGRMQAEGVGSSQPVAGNDSEEGRALNRRVEIVKR